MKKLSLVALLSFGCSSGMMTAAGSPGTGVVSRESATYSNGAVSLNASLLLPEGENKPAVVIIHGSGTSDQSNPWTAAYAEAFAARGIVVLYPDKRGSGKSTGDWRTASFEDLAEDAAAGIRFLRGRSDIDTSRIGVIAFSQGTYPASILAVNEPFCKFAIVVSGGVASLMEQTINELELEAAQAGIMVPDQAAGALRSVYRRGYEFARTGSGWEGLLDTLKIIDQSNPLLKQALRTFPRDSTHWAWRWIRATGDFDPLPYWQRTSKPVVFLYGGKDARIRVANSVQKIIGMRKDLGLTSIMFFGGNAHTHFRDDGVAFITQWIADGGKN